MISVVAAHTESGSSTTTVEQRSDSAALDSQQQQQQQQSMEVVSKSPESKSNGKGASDEAEQAQEGN